MGSRPTSPKKTFWIESPGIIFPHFSGAAGPMNRLGDRNFGLILPPADAEAMAAADYSVKTRKAMEATDEYEARNELYFLPCKLKFDGKRPPRVVMITCKTVDSCKRDVLDEGAVVLLDTANISHADCKVSPYDWGDVNDGGRTAYVQSLFVTVELDKFDAKYDDIPWADGGHIDPPIPDNIDG